MLKKIFNTFDLCLAASKESQKNLKSLFAKNIKFLGNLKFIQNPEKRLLDKKNIRILNTTKELPSNIEAEQIILGSILVNNEIFDEISTIVNENIFFDPIHQKIFHSFCQAHP